MNTNERKPLLSDADMSNGPERQVYYLEPEAIGKRVVRYLSASDVRDFYENLITSGNLRVVEECGYVPADTWCSVCICKGCGEACSEAGEKDPYPHCPYCTRKIKR